MSGKKKLFFVLPALLVALSFLLSFKLLKTGILPKVYPILFFVLMAIFAVGFVLVIFKGKKGGLITFTVFTVIFAFIIGYGYNAFLKVDGTLQDISVKESKESIAVSVVSLNLKGYGSVEDLKGAEIALCNNVESISIALKLKEINGEEVSFAKGLHDMELVDALINEYVDAIIINDAYLDIVADFEGYEDFESSVTVLNTYEVYPDNEQHDIVFDKEIFIEAVKADDKESEEVAEVAYAEPATSVADSTSDSTQVSSTTGTAPKITKVNTGGIANSSTGAHTTKLDWSNDIVTSGNNTFIAYISGIDTTGSVDVKRRSDVNILAAINLSTGTIQLIDTPRDYFVILPQVGKADKLTHAGIYGIDYSIAALERLYGIKVDYYLRMNFTGFVKMIDTIGGVDVYSDYEFTVEPVKTYTVGMNHLNGIEALAFARERYSFSSGDIQRGANQMKVVNALIQKLSSPEIVINYAGILGCVSDSFQTNMPTEMMYQIISNQISTGTNWNVSSRVSSGYGASSTTYSGPTKVGYVMTPNDDDVAAAHELIKSVVNY